MANRSGVQHDWTIERLRELPDDGNRYEIIDGVRYVTPAPRPKHQLALSLLYDRLQPFAISLGLRMLWSPSEIEYSERTVVQPDLFAFIRTRGMPLLEWRDVQPLQLVIEALSRSTRLRDRTIKRDLYIAQGVPEYWIIDTDMNVIERSRPDGREVERLDSFLTWQPVSGQSSLTIDLTDFFGDVHA